MSAPLAAANPHVRVVEVTSVLTPKPGIDIYQALHEAALSGYQNIAVDPVANTATITWYRKWQT